MMELIICRGAALQHIHSDGQDIVHPLELCVTEADSKGGRYHLYATICADRNALIIGAEGSRYCNPVRQQ